jgi:hypothetical protein
MNRNGLRHWSQTSRCLPGTPVHIIAAESEPIDVTPVREDDDAE